MSAAASVDAERIDAGLVRELLAEQFPHWAGLPVRAVAAGGNDHRMFRLGDDLSVRLPSAPGYVAQVEKEQTWLPHLAAAVPLPIPRVHGRGRPSPRFAAPWSVYGWIPGAPAAHTPIGDLERFAADLAAFLVALRAAEAADGPEPGTHSAHRGGPVGHWDREVRDLLDRVSGRERVLAEGIWRDAVAADAETGPARWLHGDVAAANLLVRDGRLAAVVDFGCAAVGDPACDTVPVWTFLPGPAGSVFRRDLALDDATWARGRGWALWKGLIMLTNTAPGQSDFARRVLSNLFAEA
ncbi:aminoglycoside phosphotransferase family protein [Microbacterium lushaniae]|uniref:Aminoglycoside phosphotransferase family protein n=1 Tax=Microbacterium lushaniae TaxID=2614639 RepID=A0A5J6L0G2_9MICO|nr:aminoglycoside phosphotransferase family protein [Microbacterium lushaniae]QEW01978.1 aminoglycoside phosphotransferase family protein [Microbacterium lushaniae]